MVKTRQVLRQVRFHNPRLSRIGVEVLDVSQLREKAGALLDAPERPDFFLLVLVRRGTTVHMVDFDHLRLAKDFVLLVRPGQVQQWGRLANLEADVVLVSPAALAPFIARAQMDMQMLALDEWPTATRHASTTMAKAFADVARLRSDIARFDGGPREAAMIWHALLALLLRLAPDTPQGRDSAADREQELYRLFMRELDKTLAARTSVRELSKRIGYSESTLSRACVAASGLSPKQVLDQRVALEAKRLLVHSQSPAAQIAQQLGFSEPTNFVKFFRRLCGTSPHAFRQANTVA